MKTSRSIILLVLGVLCFGVVGRALALGPDDPVKRDLDAAKASHADALNSANSTLAAAFDAQIKSLTASGDADSAKLLSSQKTAFITAGTLPPSPLMKQAVADYQLSMKNADGTLRDAYSTAIEGFDKESDFDSAARARKERGELLSPGASEDAGGNSSGTILTPAAIAQQLDAAKTAHQQAVDEAKKVLLNTINERVSAATDAGNLSLVESLQAVQAAAAVDGTVPDNVKDAPVIAAKRNYERALAEAKDNLTLAYQKAVRDYTRARQIALAQSTQTELNSQGLVDATAPSAMTSGTYQLTNSLPDFLTAKDSLFVSLGDRLGVYVPETNYIRTKESDLLSKNFTFDTWFYLMKGDRGDPKDPAVVVGLGDGSANIANAGPQDSLYLEINPPNPPDKKGGEVNLHRRNASSKTTIGHLADYDTYVCRIQKSGDSVTFIVGTDQSGTLVPQMSVTVDDVRNDSPYLNDQNCHLFFGSGAFTKLLIGKGPAPVAPVAGAAPLNGPIGAAPNPAAGGDPAAGNTGNNLTASSANNQPVSGKAGTIDLLALIDPSKDGVAGQWSLDSSNKPVLVNQQGKLCRIQFPYRPPEEYDFRATFTYTTNGGPVTMICPLWGGAIMWCTDFKASNFESNGQRVGNEGQGPFAGRGEMHTTLVKVRKDRVLGFLDDRLVCQYERSGKDPPQVTNKWLLCDSTLVGIAVWRSDTRFSTVQVVEISGPGTRVR